MKRYETCAKDILSALGGQNNILEMNTCISRLRIRLKDQELLHLQALEDITEIRDIRILDDQLQLIIGIAVTDIYQILTRIQ